MHFPDSRSRQLLNNVPQVTLTFWIIKILSHAAACKRAVAEMLAAMDKAGK